MKFTKTKVFLKHKFYFYKTEIQNYKHDDNMVSIKKSKLSKQNKKKERNLRKKKLNFLTLKFLYKSQIKHFYQINFSNKNIFETISNQTDR